MRVIALDNKVLRFPTVNATTFLLGDLQFWKSAGLTLQLRVEGIDMVKVDVRVAHDVGEAARYQFADVRHHVCQQCVAGNVERDAQAHVARSLVELAVQMALGLGLGVPVLASGVGDVELGKHVARREDHLVHVGGVPGGKDQATVVRVGAQLVDNLGELVDSLARVVRLGVDVLGAKVPPLEAVHGAEVADLAVGEAQVVEELAGAVAVPDLDAGLAEAGGGCVALDEPEELGDDGAGEDALGGEEGEDRGAVSVEGELEGSRGKDGVCASASPMNAVRRARQPWEEGSVFLTCLVDARRSRGFLLRGPNIGVPRD